MYIRTVFKKNKNSAKRYEYQQLVETIRTDKGVQQKLLLSLGRLPIAKERWPRLTNRIKAILQNQQALIPEARDIEELAQRFASEYIKKHKVETDIEDVQAVRMSSIQNREVREIGGETLGFSFFNRLELSECLKSCGFTKRQREIAVLLIIGRLVSPGSERHLHTWAKHLSGLGEIIKADFEHLSLNSLYKVTDLLYEHKDEIEAHLRIKEKDLFGLDEAIILYDLTNTYFEGQALSNPKAKFGRSKEKRSDAKLLTLGMVIDSQGFPKTSRIFPGNQSEPETLLDMVNTLYQQDPTSNTKPTVIIDAGIATEENLEKLKDQFHYIAVSRKKMAPPERDDCMVIKEDRQNKVEVKRLIRGNEVLLYCKSNLKLKKENSMQNRLQENFEAQLKHLSKSIHKKGCTKRYDKVLEKIGRLKEKYRSISRFYHIQVGEMDGLAKGITWEYMKEQSDKRFSGGYYLRTNRFDLSESEIWSIYVMLTEVESAFRALKTDLQMRPVFHQKEERSDAHIFITLLAYHLLHSVRSSLKKQGINLSWQTIRKRMLTHSRITNRLVTKEGHTLFVRKCTEPEDFHQTIYDMLTINAVPVKEKRYIVKICSDP